ncbi:MAG: YncE family protein [Deltaproteobacteria bacterium]|nr:YncE family protein [Deltaproteobacteria bacterium]
MLGRVAFLAIGLLALALPAQALRRVYITNINAASVTVLDAESRTILAVIPVGAEPDGVALSPDGATAWVANYADDTVTAIDTASDSAVATVAVGDGPVGLAVTPDGAEVWVTNRLAGTVTILDAATRAATGTIDIGAASGGNAIAFTPDGTRALVTQSLQDTVSVIDTAPRRVAAGVRIGRVPNRVVVAPDGARAYVSLFRGDNGSDLSSQLVAIDLATLAVVGRGNSSQPTGLALSADARTVYLVNAAEVQRFDAASLDLLGILRIGNGLNGILPLDERTLLVADTPRSLLRALPATFSLDDYGTPPLPAPVPVAPGPFALAALPQREPDRLVAAITAPSFGAKLDRSASAEVRIVVAAGDLPLAQWSLVLRRSDGTVPDQPLAAGRDAVADAVVATVRGADLVAGTGYALVLTVQSADGSSIARQLPFSVPNRRYALVPLRGSRSDYESRLEMDAEARQFIAGVRPYAIDIYNTETGNTYAVATRLELTDTDRVVMARGGQRVGIIAAGSSGLGGTLDLVSGQAWLVPYRPYRFDLDADGEWLVTFRIETIGERYQLFDLTGGARYLISDVPGDDGGGAACESAEAQRPRLSADGSRVAFLTGFDLGLGSAQGCRLVAYERATRALRLVTELTGHTVGFPTMDDAGAQFGVVLGPAVAHPNSGRRATLIDMTTGERTDLLGDNPAQSFDAALSGDGRSVIVSSCADLDPSVGNADRNDELFHLDLASGVFSQITDTQGGETRCELVRGASYDPLVSRDGQQLSFVMLDASEAGAPRSLRNGLAFGAVRAVPVVDGNTPPKFELEGETTVLVGARLGLTLRSGDRDADPIRFFAQMGEMGLPDGVSFRLDPNDPQAFVQWYPPPDAAGEHTLRLGVFDDRGGETVRDVTLSVCRFFLDGSAREQVAGALFDPLPAACGNADRNADGVVSAADLVATGAAAG